MIKHLLERLARDIGRLLAANKVKSIRKRESVIVVNAMQLENVKYMVKIKINFIGVLKKCIFKVTPIKKRES